MSYSSLSTSTASLDLSRKWKRRMPHDLLAKKPRLSPPSTSGPTIEELTQLQAAFNLPAELGLWRAYMTSVKTAKGDIVPLMDGNDAGSKFSTTRRRTGIRPANSGLRWFPI
ncbi:hypothetical protein PI124_g21099 [Phytophthora idaei]|nr:hypothetical protein PI125_g22660 [Phytophthora idaei]KAG3129760.1 hypothetical protein PI126_g20817 [Phytophthora idaei]KAG3233837.1 hypothetical protein PI124_g21099 [Phytophthora idaei]